MQGGKTFISLALVFTLASCALPKLAEKTPEKAPSPVDELVTLPLDFDQLPGWADDSHGAVMPAVRESCKKLNSQPGERSLGGNGVAGIMANWRQACYAAAYVEKNDHQKAKLFFEKWFRPYVVQGEGLFTGYFEASLNGSPFPTPRYRFPLYKRPDDLVLVDLGKFKESLKGKRTAGRVVQGRLQPYQDRAAIRRGALLNRGLELLWVDDPIDAFFLHIQGSGRVTFEDGTSLRIGYDGHNGHDYYAIGRELVNRGILSTEEVSLQSIRKWLRENLGQSNQVMDLNKSYIFFRTLPDKGLGPIGAQGVPLTPGRSLAIDKQFIPMGIPLWLDTTDPLKPETPLRRLVVAQDTGGAIKGTVRGDLFWGHGPEALGRAGVMKQQGKYYLLLPRALNN